MALKGRTTGKEIAQEVYKCFTEKSELKFENLISMVLHPCRKNVSAAALVELLKLWPECL